MLSNFLRNFFLFRKFFFYPLLFCSFFFMFCFSHFSILFSSLGCMFFFLVVVYFFFNVLFHFPSTLLFSVLFFELEHNFLFVFFQKNCFFLVQKHESRSKIIFKFRFFNFFHILAWRALVSSKIFHTIT